VHLLSTRKRTSASHGNGDQILVICLREKDVLEGIIA
jgi:hypothetical protein